MRARVVADYAQTRLGLKGRGGDGWKQVLKTLAARAEEDEISSELRERIEKEIQSTLAGLGDAKAAVEKARAVMSGVKEAAAKRDEVASPGAAPEGGG